jgi:cyclase
MTAFRYPEILSEEARQRYDARLYATDAAYDIELGEFAGWRDSERIVPNVNTRYRELAGQPRAASIVPLFAQMARNPARRRIP